LVGHKVKVIVMMNQFCSPTKILRMSWTGP